LSIRADQAAARATLQMVRERASLLAQRRHLPPNSAKPSPAGAAHFRMCSATAVWGIVPNLEPLVNEISARPTAQKAVALKDRHKFKTEMDAEAMQAMFPHLTMKVA
jgi:hypothetical protein